ncbi:MAG TPA: LytTR family DNA-binding domain-containing protein [Candidatus Baltobacteraceae bacterium]|jgi:two-component system LytT family response regulator
MMLRVAIVDDEAPARRKLARFLAEFDDVDVVGEAGGGADAIALVRKAKPDVLFLDIQMPEVDGFDVVEELAGDAHVPRVIFATAFDQHAIRAFEVSALDYLLKPLERERLGEAIARARAAVAPDQPPSRDRLLEVLDALRPERRFPKRLLVPGEERSVFVDVAEIVRLEADGNNVRVVTARGTHTMRATLESLEAKLDPERFARVHRSHVVNLDAIKEIQPWFHGDRQIVLRDGTGLTWSRRYAAKRPDLA